MEVALPTQIKEECDDWAFNSLLEDDRNKLSSLAKMVSKPAMAVIFLHSLPNAISCGFAENSDSNEGGLLESSRKVYRPSPQSKIAGAVNQIGIPDKNMKLLQDEQVALYSKKAEKCHKKICKFTSNLREVRSSSTDVPVLPSDASFSNAHKVSRSKERRQRKKGSRKNDQNRAIPECAEDLLQTINASTSKGNCEGVLKAVKIEEKDCIQKLPSVRVSRRKERQLSKKASRKNYQNRVIPECAEDPLQTINANTSKVNCEGVLKAVRIEEKDCIQKLPSVRVSRSKERRPRKKACRKNYHNRVIPECAEDPLQTINASNSKVNCEDVLKAVKIEEKEGILKLPSVREEILNNKVYQEVDSYGIYSIFIPDNVENEGQSTLNFNHTVKNVEKKNKDRPVYVQKAQGVRKGRNKFFIQQTGDKKKKIRSKATKSVENAKQRSKKKTKSKSQKKHYKMEPNINKASKRGPECKAEKETKLESLSKSHKNLSKVADEKSFRGEVPRDQKTKFASVMKGNNISETTAATEEKPERKLKPKLYQCEYCSSTFSRMDYLKLHIMHHTNEKPFKCDICMKGFRMRWRVRLHRATHFDDKPHHCHFCPYRSIRRDGLHSHIKRVHKNVACDKKNCLLDHFHW